MYNRYIKLVGFCKDICPAWTIHGSTWEMSMNGDLIVDIYHCDGCLKWLSNFHWSQKYINNNSFE